MQSHADLLKWYTEWETLTEDERTLAERDRDYYDGDQWTAEEREKFRLRNQPVITINRIAPKVNYILGTEIRIRTDPKAEPRTPMDEDVADAVTDSIRYVCDVNKFDQVRTRAFRDLFVEGMCGGEVCVKRKRKDVLIQIKRIPWDRIVYDPHASEEDFSDGKYRGTVMWMDADEAYATWKGARDVIDATAGSDGDTNSTHEDKPRNWYDSSRRRIKVTQLYWREPRDQLDAGEIASDDNLYDEAEEQWFCATLTGGGFLREPELASYVDEFGDTECPIVLQACYVTRDNAHYGAIRNLISPQDEVNHRRSRALNIINMRQTKSTKGAFEDIQSIKAEMAKPDAHIEVPPGMDFEILETNSMAAEQFQLLEEAKREIDAIGPSAASTGHDTRVLSGRSQQVAQQSGQTELEPIFDGARNWQHSIYKLVYNRIKQFWPMSKYIRVRDSDQNLKFVQLNQPVTKRMLMVEQAEAQGVELPPEMLADPSLDEVVGKRNNVAEWDMDISVTDVPDTVGLRQEQFETMAELKKAGVMIPDDALIELSAIRNKKAILDKMRGSEEQQQMQQQQQQAQAQAMQQMQQVTMAKEQAEVQETQASAAQKQASADSTTLDMHIKAAHMQAGLGMPSGPQMGGAQ